MSNSYKPGDLKINIHGAEIQGFVCTPTQEWISIPYLDIMITMPNGNKTGLSINTEALVRHLCDAYPDQMKKLVKEIE